VTNYTQERGTNVKFRDPYAVHVTVPTVSWKYARIGDGWRGIILPNDKGESYKITQQTDENGNPKWWDEGKEDPKQQQDVLLGFLQDVKSGAPINDDDWISSAALERFAVARKAGDPEASAMIKLIEDLNLRRQLIKGESMEKGMLNAVRELSADLGPRPVIGATLKIILGGLEPNVYKGETKIYEVEYGAPTEETRAKVQEYLSARPAKNDPYQESKAPGASPAGRPTPVVDDDDDEGPPF
jgi:hypothetical protein